MKKILLVAMSLLLVNTFTFADMKKVKQLPIVIKNLKKMTPKRIDDTTIMRDIEFINNKVIYTYDLDSNDKDLMKSMRGDNDYREAFRGIIKDINIEELCNNDWIRDTLKENVSYQFKYYIDRELFFSQTIYNIDCK